MKVNVCVGISEEGRRDVRGTAGCKGVGKLLGGRQVARVSASL